MHQSKGRPRTLSSKIIKQFYGAAAAMRIHKFRTLLIGLGKIGVRYDFDLVGSNRVSSFAKALEIHPAFSFIGAVDISCKARKFFAENFSVETFSTVREAMSKTAPEIVIIAVPTNVHFDVFNEVIEYSSVKGIMCEKPLSTTYEEARRMVELAEKSNILLFTNYMRRCDRGLLKVRNWIMTGRIQAPVEINCRYSNGMYNNASHFVNLLEFWFGDFNSWTMNEQINGFKKIDPSIDFSVFFDAGSAHFRAVSENDQPINCMRLDAGNGYLNYQGGKLDWYPLNLNLRRSISKPYSISTDSSSIQLRVVEELQNAMLGRESPICTGRQGLNTINVLTRLINNE